MAVQRVTCDQCAKPFDIALKDRPLPGGGMERRFRCPHCKRWYTVAIYTPLGVRTLQELVWVEVQLRGRPDDQGLKDQLTELRERLGPEVSAPAAQ